MKMYKGEQEVEVEKIQLPYFEADGWSLEKPDPLKADNLSDEELDKDLESESEETEVENSGFEEVATKKSKTKIIVPKSK